MTLFGKFLVFVNLVLSLLFAAWALAVFMLRADPTDTVYVSSADKDKRVHVGGEVSRFGVEDKDVAKIDKDAQDPTAVLISGLKEGRTRVNVTAGGKEAGFDVTVDKGAPGELSERREELFRLHALNTQTEARWLAAYNEIRDLQKQRPADQKWYREQLQALERGDQPVEAVVYNKGEPQIEQGRPKLDKLAPELHTRDYYLKQIDQAQTQVQEAREKVRAQIQAQGKLTDDLKKMRVQLADDEEALRKIRDEHDYLDPMMYNRQAESQLVLDRQQRLRDRVIELLLGVRLERGTTAVAEVTPKGPAARAGLKAGDVIVGAAGGKTATPQDVLKALLTHSPGDRIPVELRRGDKDVPVEVELGGALGGRR
jgi:hypothetical protein